jgi:NAD-dependent deacetylase
MKSDGPEIVVLTGAGVSAESGIATFRGTDGLWEGHRIEDVASPEGFDRKPQLVHRFYNLRRAALRTVQPNAAHSALARLEAAWPGAFLLVTQNVDDLHERAGSRRLIHMHGELRNVRCTACSASWPWEEETSTHSRCPSCGDTGTVRPDIVWFGEMPIDMDRPHHRSEPRRNRHIKGLPRTPHRPRHRNRPRPRGRIAQRPPQPLSPAQPSGISSPSSCLQTYRPRK